MTGRHTNSMGTEFSESGVESLIRLRGRRRVLRFAGSIGASSVAFRGAGYWAGRGDRSINKKILRNWMT